MKTQAGNNKIKSTQIQTIHPAEIRKEFPILNTQVNGKPLIYFDNAATTQKPKVVIDSITNYYRNQNANIHRGLHELSDRATQQYEQARKKTADFIHAKEKAEINFLRGTTEAINLVASAWGNQFLQQGDEIMISQMEHHSNIVPWYRICKSKGCRLKIIPLNDVGELNMETFASLLNAKTKLVSVAYISNALGLINPIQKIIDIAHQAGALVMLDAAQAVQHTKIDVQSLDCDFLAFSGHKMYAPTGIGVLYAKRAILESMQPYQSGGEMIDKVGFDEVTYNELPYKFEAGTPNICGAIALGTAIDFIQDTGMDNIQRYEHELITYASDALKTIKGLRIYGENAKNAPVISFNIEGLHHYDIGSLLNQYGIAIRTGHHCTQPLMDFFGISGTCRASFAFYNTKEEIDRMIQALNHIIKMLTK